MSIAAQVPTDVMASITAGTGVYAPQHDSYLLADALARLPIEGADVLDLCTGSGILAITAAALRARSVTALDISERAINCARRNASDAGVRIDAHVGSHEVAAKLAPFGIITCNPPYVPADSVDIAIDDVRRAWDAGPDGRLVLDPVCRSARALLRPGGVVLMVHSEFSGTEQTLSQLTATGLRAEVINTAQIPFGSVMTARAQWLEETGRLEPGRRTENLVVIQAERESTDHALH